LLYALREKSVVTQGDFFVAPSAQLIGQVELGHEASVWFNAVIRADTDWIRIGAGSNVQDGTVIHTDPGYPTSIGAEVTIGHMALLHSCDVGDESLIGNGAMLLDRVRVGRQCIIAAGTLLPPDKVIPDRSVVMGAPGRIVREVTAEDLRMIAHGAATYRERAARYRAELCIDPRTPA